MAEKSFDTFAEYQRVKQSCREASCLSFFFFTPILLFILSCYNENKGNLMKSLSI